ncbi:U3 small nucleolar RNA-associated protein 23 [Nematocida sp. AWRm77]|nr:U3 small nucleolar RNA-associated protein 23 [Nematocida sp. AWRm77]
MRTPRLKQLRKLMKRLMNVGFRAPFNVFADHSFLVSFNASRMSIKHIEHVLGGQIKLCTTQCELKKYKETVSDKELIGHVQVKRCTQKNADHASCFLEHVQEDNPHHYFLAVSLKNRKLKEEKRVPVIFLRAGVLCVEIGEISDSAILKQEYSQGLSQQEKDLLEKMFSTPNE